MNKFFGFASAIALAAGFSLSSCSSDDNVAEEMNPNYDGKAEVVKTQFAISVPSGNKSSRMSQNEAQTGNVFQGMQDIHMYTIQKAVDGADFQNGTDQIAGAIRLDDIDALSNTSNAKKYNDISLDVNVNHILFYGRTKIGSQKGETVATWDVVEGKTLDRIKFTPKVIRTASLASDEESGVKILAALNAIVQVDGWKGNAVFGKYYDEFIKLRVGSAEHVLSAVRDLYNSVNKQEAGDQGTMQTNIKNAITGNFSVGVPADDGFPTLAWNNGVDTTFPKNLGLPVGCVRLKYTDSETASEHTFAFDETQNSLNKAYVSPKLIVKPAALYYFGNSTLATSETAYDGLLTAGKTWEEILKSTYGGGQPVQAGKVSKTTRSVSMIKPVQYGVSVLKTMVKLSSNDILDAEDKAIVKPEHGYSVKGILVGGQKTVGWDFNQVGDVDYTVYDGEWTGTAKATESEMVTSNPTLLLPSAKGVNLEHSVYVAVELVNDGKSAFKCADGIVKPGATFYMTAKLNPAGESATANGADRVFMQDRATVAKFTINSLKQARIAIPDLRPSKMEFGMSVDLKWEDGYTFDQNFD